MRLIDADELLERLRNAEAFYKHDTAGDFDMGRGLGLNEAQQKVAEQPAIEAEPVKHGKWERRAHFAGSSYICTNCKYVAREMPECMGEPIYDYCPNCGARMDGES